MIKSLTDLIAGARAATESKPVWVMDGGRACPIGWMDCSQPVFRDAGSDAWDYGEPGGPGAADCNANCPHGMQPCEDDDEEDSAEIVESEPS